MSTAGASSVQPVSSADQLKSALQTPTQSKRATRKKKEPAAPPPAGTTVKRRVLEPGNIITSPTHTYTVVKLLGSGGFGDVYLVEEEQSKVRYALKTEFYGGIKRLFSRLKIEAHVLEKCTKTAERKHFLSLRDKGTTSDFKFMCMDVVGPSLESVRKKSCDGEFSKGTALNVSMRTLKSVHDLHALGFLHRDIKPANFSIGLGRENETCIFMLDFGIAREFKNPNGTLRKPRENVPFLGTPRFAARACHKGVEQSPKDDVETWIYMVYDLFDTSALPWKMDRDRDLIVKKKDDMMLGKKNCSRKTHKDFLKVVKYVGKLEYIDNPDYAWITSVLESMGRSGKLDWDDSRVDWVGKIPVSPVVKLPDEQNSCGQTGEDNEEEEGGGGGGGGEGKPKGAEQSMRKTKKGRTKASAIAK